MRHGCCAGRRELTSGCARSTARKGAYEPAGAKSGRADRGSGGKGCVSPCREDVLTALILAFFRSVLQRVTVRLFCLVFSR